MGICTQRAFPTSGIWTQRARVHDGEVAGRKQAWQLEELGAYIVNHKQNKLETV